LKRERENLFERNIGVKRGDARRGRLSVLGKGKCSRRRAAARKRRGVGGGEKETFVHIGKEWTKKKFFAYDKSNGMRNRKGTTKVFILQKNWGSASHMTVYNTGITRKRLLREKLPGVVSSNRNPQSKEANLKGKVEVPIFKKEVL